MQRVVHTAALRAIVTGLLAFVFAFAPMAHAMMMPAGHAMSIQDAQELAQPQHHHAAQQTATHAEKKHAGCDDQQGSPSEKQSCCDVGCLSIAALPVADELLAPTAFDIPVAGAQSHLLARDIESLKRPPRI